MGKEGHRTSPAAPSLATTILFVKEPPDNGAARGGQTAFQYQKGGIGPSRPVASAHRSPFGEWAATRPRSRSTLVAPRSVRASLDRHEPATQARRRGPSCSRWMTLGAEAARTPPARYWDRRLLTAIAQIKSHRSTPNFSASYARSVLQEVGSGADVCASAATPVPRAHRWASRSWCSSCGRRRSSCARSSGPRTPCALRTFAGCPGSQNRRGCALELGAAR